MEVGDCLGSDCFALATITLAEGDVVVTLEECVAALEVVTANGDDCFDCWASVTDVIVIGCCATMVVALIDVTTPGLDEAVVGIVFIDDSSCLLVL